MLKKTPKYKQTDTNNKQTDTNNKQAIALTYDRTKDEGAPEISATGYGEIADKILQIAKENEIPIEKNPDLVALLATKEVGEEIPVEAFIAVAEILKFIYTDNGTNIA